MSTPAASEPVAAVSRGLRVLAWALFLAAAGFSFWGLVATTAYVLDGSHGVLEGVTQLSVLVPAAAFSIVGLLLALRRSANPAGWLMLVIGLGWSVVVIPVSGPEPRYFSALAWVLPFGLMGTHLLLRLPDGGLLSPRWRWVSRLSTVAIVAAGVWLPAGDNAPVTVGSVVGTVGLLALVACTLLSVTSLVVRARRASADERHQLRWIAMGAATFFAVYALSFVPALLGIGKAGDFGAIVLTAYAAIPIGIGVAVLRYRLYEIDVVIRKALVAAALAVFFVAIYALVVGGVGALLENRSTGVSFAAAVLAAALFQPVLARARRFADRVVYGDRATPYEVLSDFGERISGTYAADDVLARTAQVLGEGVGADRAVVWLSVSGTLQPVASWSRDGNGDGRADDFRAEVRHQGEVLGALSVTMPASDPLDPTKTKLIEDLASQAGLLLRNVRLVEDLRASRRRLVSAQDEERRRLERNIHDGAQQQLVALAVKARLARSLTERDPSRAAEMLEQIETETQAALEDLRDLARGVYPPLLADKGLVVALESQARKATMPVDIQSDGIGRYGQQQEAAVYFCVLEALQNAAKYAHASRATVTLGEHDGTLAFAVADDGDGFDASQVSYGTGLQGIADRLNALDGQLKVESWVGDGTVVRGSLPAALARDPMIVGADRG